MKQNFIKIKTIYIISFLFFLALSFSGCAGYNNIFQKSSNNSSDAKPYYSSSKGFNDILIPKELSIDMKSSYVVETPDFISGILVYEGSVTRDSLIEFFKTNMQKDSWKMLTSLTSPRTNTILLFQKTSRWCIINIEENRINTHVEIAVAPTLKEASPEIIEEAIEPK